MTALKKRDIVEYIALINLQFPNAYQFANEKDRTSYIELWFAGLKFYPKELCDAGVKNAILKSEFAPKIATVIAEIEKLIETQRPGDTKLWDELIAAIRKAEREIPYASSRYNEVVHEDTGLTTAGEACKAIACVYDSLSAELKEYCGSMRGFIDIAQMSEEELRYEKGRFLKQLPNLRERIKAVRNLPPQLTDVIKCVLESKDQKMIGIKNV